MSHFEIRDSVINKVWSGEYLSLEEAIADGAIEQQSPFGNGYETYLLLEGKRHGPCMGFFSNGEKQSESFYQRGHLHGPVRYYALNGTLLSESFYFEGKKCGPMRLWFPSGTLYSDQHFIEGVRHGVALYYYDSGQLRTRMHYQEGSLEGTTEQFYEEGQPRRRIEYRQGLRHGLDEMLTRDGLPIMLANYEQAQPVGQLQLFHENGELAEHYYYHGPAWRFDVKRYDRQGRLWQEGYSLKVETVEGLQEHSYEEKTYDRQGKITLHERAKRSSEGKTLETEKLEIPTLTSSTQ